MQILSIQSGQEFLELRKSQELYYRMQILKFYNSKNSCPKIVQRNHEGIEFQDYINMSNLLFPQETNKLLGLAMQLHRELGCSFPEKVFQDAFEILLQENNIPYEREKHLSVVFHDKVLPHDFFVDFLCYGNIIVELKSYPEMLGEFEAQAIDYINVGKYPLGVVLNFGMLSLGYKFVVNKSLLHCND